MTVHCLFDLNLSQRTMVLIVTGWNWKWNPFEIYEWITLFSVVGFFVSVFFRLFVVWCVLFMLLLLLLLLFLSSSISCEHVILLRSHNYIPCSHADKRCAAQSDTRFDIFLSIYWFDVISHMFRAKCADLPIAFSFYHVIQCDTTVTHCIGR